LLLAASWPQIAARRAYNSASADASATLATLATQAAPKLAAPITTAFAAVT